VDTSPSAAPSEEGSTASSHLGNTPHTASVDSNQERLICRSRPVLGSRIARQRECKTAEQWRIYQADLEQSRRDINDRGMRGCGPGCE
jgi:hypothetical protein